MGSAVTSEKGSVLNRAWHRNKAVSDGAISFYLDHYVRARVAKVTYGEFAWATYDSSLAEHRKRSHTQENGADGVAQIPGRFSIMVPKVCCDLTQRI